MDHYATAGDIAAYFRISKSLAYKMANEALETPESGVIRIGTAIRINPAKFEAYLKAKERKNELQEEISNQES